LSIETENNQKANVGGILKFIALGMIRMLFIPTPKLEEQEKIASCLSAVDDLITAQQEKIEQLQQHKKGLMQGLFPRMTH
jgi:type I restriction enzyme S subunit